MIIYQSLEAGYKDMVRQYLRCSEIIMKTQKDYTTEAKITIIEKIIHLFANHIPLDRIYRMVT